MRKLTLSMLVIFALLLAGCGRQLSDEYFQTNTDFAEGERPADTVAAADTADDTTEDAETDDTPSDEADSEADDAETTDETATEDEVAESTASEEETTEDAVASEPETVLVEAPVDPIVEQVANADAANGEVLFNSGVTCTSCHYVDSEDRLVGPGLLNIPQMAEARVEGEIAERYLYNSIILPNDYVVEGYPAAMFASYPDQYTEEEMLDIVAYLMTLGDYPEREPQFIEVPAETVADGVVEESELDTATAEDSETAVEATAESVETADTDVSEAEVEATPETVDAETTPESVDVAEETTSSDDTSETETTAPAVNVASVPFEPSYTLDFSNVPQTIDTLAQFGSVGAGEAVFADACASCHTIDGNPGPEQSDLSTVGTAPDAASYIWAATFSSDVHAERIDISTADAAHLVAYLLSLSEAQTSAP